MRIAKIEYLRSLFFIFVCNTIVFLNFSEERRFYAISTFYIFCDVAIGFGPALLGFFVIFGGGYWLVYLVSSVITLFALPICVYTLKRLFY